MDFRLGRTKQDLNQLRSEFDTLKAETQNVKIVNEDLKTANAELKVEAYNETLTRLTGRKLQDWWMDLDTQKDRLSNEQLQWAVQHITTLHKGYHKKSRDCTFDWYTLDSPIDGDSIPDATLEKIYEFDEAIEFKKKLQTFVWDGLWQGNGWMEYIGQGNKDPDQPLTGKLVNIINIDPTTIKQPYWVTENGQTYIKYWVQKVGWTDNKYIHHTRLAHFAPYKIGDVPFGYSPTFVASATVKHKYSALNSVGELIDYFVHPFPVINTGSKSDKDFNNAVAYLEAIKKKKSRIGAALKEGATFELHNPSTIDNIDDILNAFDHELAQVIEMPYMLLMGVQQGQLTGSVHELNDYYKSVKAWQDLDLSLVVRKAYRLLIGENFNPKIIWNPLFVDEKTEIENKTKLMKEVGELYSKHGIIELMEARQLLREFDIGIPEGGTLDEEEPEEDENDFREPEEPEDEDETAEATVRKPNKAELSYYDRIRIKREQELADLAFKEGRAG